jgi:hypothetical protein
MSSVNLYNWKTAFALALLLSVNRIAFDTALPRVLPAVFHPAYP